MILCRRWKATSCIVLEVLSVLPSRTLVHIQYAAKFKDHVPGICLCCIMFNVHSSWRPSVRGQTTCNNLSSISALLLMVPHVLLRRFSTKIKTL
jgi:hypothetical protein